MATRWRSLPDAAGNACLRGLGYQRIEWTASSGRKFEAFGHDGYGGSCGFACPELKMAYS